LVSGGGGLLAMIERLATNASLNMDVFDRLLAARREEEDRAAKRAFNAAISLAKGELSPVLKTHDVDFTSAKGTRTRYKHETFADVAKVVDPVFARYGLSYRFRVQQQGDLAKVICVVSHADGYSEENPLEGRVDPGASSMNMVQALGSLLTYLQRYSLRGAIGLAAGVDDDGRAAGGQAAKISAEQAKELEDLIEATGRSQVRLFRLFGVSEATGLTLDQFTRIKENLIVDRAERQRATKQPAAPGN
jgi:hypothetical protein